MSTEQTFPRPDRWHLLTEAPRMVSEVAALLPTAPFLSQAPRGDGHPVLVLPGFGGGDTSTRLLRRYLGSLGHGAKPWTLGQNRGRATPNLHENLADRLSAVYRESGERKVSLVGWSLGGVYARILAHRFPSKVRQVITLGSPIGGHPRSTNAYAVAKRVTKAPLDDEVAQERRKLAASPLPEGIPSSALYSKSDGIVPWQIAIQHPGDFAENIEIFGSHIGLGFNPTVLFAVADRLALPENGWAPFAREGWKKLAYGDSEQQSRNSA